MGRCCWCRCYGRYAGNAVGSGHLSWPALAARITGLTGIAYGAASTKNGGGTN